MDQTSRSRVCVIHLEFFFPDFHSLKEKRMILRKLKDRFNSRFNVSVAEVGYQDLWQRSIMALASISADHGVLEQLADRVVHEAEEAFPGGLIHYYVDYL
jgi:uncharacterized protein